MGLVLAAVLPQAVLEALAVAVAAHQQLLEVAVRLGKALLAALVQELVEAVVVELGRLAQMHLVKQLDLEVQALRPLSPDHQLLTLVVVEVLPGRLVLVVLEAVVMAQLILLQPQPVRQTQVVAVVVDQAPQQQVRADPVL